MTKHEIDFIAKEPFVGGITMDLDPFLTEGQKEDAAINEIEFAHPELVDVEVTRITEIN